MLDVARIFADGLNQLRVGYQTQTDLRVPRLRISLGVVNGESDLERTNVRPPEALGDVQRLSLRRPI